MKKAAFFDIDGTVFRSSLVIELTEALIDHRIFPGEARREYWQELQGWLNREDSYDKYVQALVRAFMKHLKGVSYKEFMEVVEEMLAEHQYRVYRYTRDLIKDLARNDYYLVAISQSPKSVIEKFCKPMGFHKTYGCIYELGPNNRFTGAVTDEHLIMNKANIVKRVVDKEQLTLDDSVSIGDSEGDIPMLEMTTAPICFNPNSILYRHAKMNGWKVVVERKDVIYNITN